MFTALTLSLALGAPVPPPADPVAAGAAPRLMEIKPDANGKVTVTVLRTELQKVQVAVGGAVNPNGAPPANLVREVPVTKTATVELGEVKDLTITTADGKKVDKEEAVKKLAGGAVVVVSADGKPVSPVYLKVFKDDTLVLASPELAGPAGFARPPIGGVRPVPLPAPLPPGGVQILPVQPGNVQVIPVQGNGVNGVIQVQVGPVAPAVLPAAPVEKAPEKKNP